MSSPVQPGTVIAGKYRVTGPIGEGGMGIVFAAEHLQLQRTVAIKFLRADASSAQIERFARESRIAVSLESEHVCKVFDVGTLPTGEPYTVMELLRGQDLSQLVASHGPLAVTDAVDHLLQACEALAEAHVLGVVHRDLKPGNLFMTRRIDGSACIKVLDFGISKIAAEHGNGGQALTIAGAVLGSPRFISPEQISQSSAVDARADIWALGVVLHELLSGQAAFAAETVGELCFEILNDDPPPLSQVRGDVPSDLAGVVARCLRKEPGERFANVAELALALAPFGSGASDVSMQRATAVYTARGWQPPPGLAPKRSTGSIRHPSSQTPATSKKTNPAAIAAVITIVALLGVGGAWLSTRSGDAADEKTAAASNDEETAKSSSKKKKKKKKKKAPSPPTEPLKGEYVAARAALDAGKAEDARKRADAILDKLSEAGVGPGDPRSRFGAETQILKAEALASMVRAPTLAAGASAPVGFERALEKEASIARSAYANVFLWKHFDLYLCAAVEGALVLEKAAMLVAKLPLPPKDAPSNGHARAKDDYATAYEDLLSFAKLDLEGALRVPTHDRRCRAGAETGLARIAKLPAKLELP